MTWANEDISISEIASRQDKISGLQAYKFAVNFNLKNLRVEDGYWVADDGDDNESSPYKISEDNYYGAIYEGDFKP